jgi:hypothetical protein
LAQFGLLAVVVQTSWGRFCFGGGVVIVPVGNAGTTFHPCPGCRGVRGGVAGQGERGTVNNTVKFGMFGMRHFEVSMTLKICMIADVEIQASASNHRELLYLMDV